MNVLQKQKRYDLMSLEQLQMNDRKVGDIIKLVTFRINT